MDRREEYERIGRERLAAEREAERAARVRMARVCVELVLWCLAAMFVMGSGFAVSDPALGRILLLAGMTLGYAGMLLTLLLAWLRARDAGDIT